MDTLIRDLRYALRGLARTPGFTTAAVLTLGLGIGANTAIFSVVDATLLRPLPYPNPERLVEIAVEVPEPDGRVLTRAPSVQDVRDWQDHGEVFSHLAFSQGATSILDSPEPARVEIRFITEDYLDVHGVAPFLGRGIEREDVREGAPAVVLLGYGFWQSRFGSDRGAIGRVIRIDNEPAAIIGVLPPAFYRESRIWRPLQTSSEMIAVRGAAGWPLGRLRPGISVEQARRTLTELTTRLDEQRGRSQAKGSRAMGIRVQSLYDTTTEGYRTTTNILAAAVGFILLIACVNVAGLLLARGAARRSEMAIRSSIGAGRARLVRQLLTESLVLSAAGGVVGLLFSSMTLDTLVANIPLSLPPNSPVDLNPQVLAFTAALSIATGLAFGLVPAFSLSRVTIREALADAGRHHGPALSRRGGQILIAVEISLAVVLLAGAGLMIRSFARVLAVDVGFDPESFVTMEVVPVETSGATLEQYYPALVQSLRSLPSIEAVGAVDHLPLSGSTMMTDARAPGARWAFVNVHQFLPGYFEAIGFPLKEGRFPTEADAAAQMPVAMLNESAAREIFPDGSAMERTFQVRTTGKTLYQVLGVVRDVRHGGPLRAPEPEVYLPFRRTAGPLSLPLIVVVRPRGRAPALGEQLRQTAQAMGTRVIVDRVRPGSEWFGERIVTPRKQTVLLGLLGGLGLLLTLVGVFGVTAYAVARRTHEIGVRMAFGAPPGDAVRTMIADAVWPVGIGILVGLGGATLTTRVIASFLFETPPTDLLTFAAVAITLGAAACFAAWIPARRAARVDPIVALRYE